MKVTSASYFVIITFSIIWIKSDAVPISENKVEEDAKNQDSSFEDKNWKITQKWLIESINRLRQEINDLGHNYEVHTQTKDSQDVKNQQDFIHDVAVLRADHSVLANQQKKIIHMIQEWRKAPSATKAETQDDIKSRAVQPHRHKSHRRRHLKRPFKDFMVNEKKFERQTAKNVTELFSEVSSLHDITLALFHDVQDLEQRLSKVKKDRQEEDHDEEEEEGDQN